MSLSESVDEIKAEVAELKEDLDARLAALQAQADAATEALDAADIPGATAKLAEVKAGIDGLRDTVGNADNNDTPNTTPDPEVPGDETPTDPDAPVDEGQPTA